MTPSTLPNKLWRSLAEVKRYVEKMPCGVLERDLKTKVSAFGSLNKKEQLQLIEFLSSRESILVLKVIKKGNKKPTTILRHKKYGYPKSIDGYEYPIKKKIDNEKTLISPKNHKGKDMTTLSSPEQLRKQAEELLKAAEQVEKNQATEKWKAEFKREFEQQKLEIMQAVGMVNRKFDELMDAVSSLGKVSEKFKSLKIN